MSDFKIAPLCPHFGLCGGCVYQDISYADEIKLKEEAVLTALKDYDFTYLGIKGAPSYIGYRNKMEFSFGDEQKGGPLALGLRKKRSFYEVVTCSQCNIMDADFRNILISVLEFFRGTCDAFYHKRSRKGSLRHLVVRKGFFTGEILINVVTTSALVTDLTPLAENIAALPLEGKAVGVLHTINDSVADIVKSDEMRILYGRDYFYETILGLTFKIGPFSFFQTNSAAAAYLYETVKEFVGAADGRVIFDLYCGTGTIAQLAASGAVIVFGVELSNEAVCSAIENAAQNNIHNCEFIAGDVLKTVDNLQQKPNIVILDPPREGVHPKAIQKILALEPEEIIYVSCKPSSLANDLRLFSEGGYSIGKLRIHDMFPRTAHVECVILMSRKDV